jgi:hypothetical protein
MAGSTGQGAGLTALHVAVLTAFAASQPMFELLARYPEFLVAHQVDNADIAWIALGLGVGLPGCFGLVAWIGAKALGSRSAAVSAGFVAGLMAAIALPGFETFGDSAPIEFGAAVLVGIASASVYHQVAAARAFVTLLTPVLLLFPALFAWNVGNVAAEGDGRWRSIAARSQNVQSDAPVVVVVFDALPLNSLLGEDGAIDAHRHPNFAALAARSHWYDNATTVAERTTYALPAILTGTYPDQIRAAIANEYPQNLFTVLSNVRSLNVIEPFTRLCPRALCDERASRGHRFESITSDLVVLFLNRLLPDGTSTSLPAVGTTWKNFAQRQADDGIRSRRADSSWIFERFVERIGDPELPDGHFARERSPGQQSPLPPPLHFIHINLPHRPYRYLPSGIEYGPIGSFGLAHGARKGVWQDDEWEVVQALQRHLLQLRFADELLGRLVRRLEQADSFDDALVVVTADHGISFRKGVGMRQVHRTNPLRNAGDILRVPLFVKLPGQTEAVRSDRNVQSIDILPTIMDALGGRLTEPVDGVSALAESKLPSATRAEKTVYVRDGSGRTALHVTAKLPLGESVRHRLGISATADLFAMGRHPELHGRPVDALAMLDRSGVETRLIDASDYADVDPDSAFLPAQVAGELLFDDENGQRELAVAINGVIRATTRTYDDGAERQRFTAMVAPTAFRAGRNTVEVFVIRERAGRIALEPTEHRPEVSYFGIADDAGNIGAIGSSDGRTYPLMPGVVVGQVEINGAYFEGEAVDARRDRAADSLLVFGGGRLLHVQPLALGQKNAEAIMDDSDGKSGVAPRHRRFHFAIPYGRLGGDSSAHVQFVGLARDGASRIRYRRDAGTVDSENVEPAWLGPIGTLELGRKAGLEGLSVGNRWVPIDSERFAGGVEAVGGEAATVSGWVTERSSSAGPVLVFSNGTFVAAVPIDATGSSFELTLPGRDPSTFRFIVTSADGTAAELEYPASR